MKVVSAIFGSLLLGATCTCAQETFQLFPDDQGEDQLDSNANDPGNAQSDIAGVLIGSEGTIGWIWDNDVVPTSALRTCSYWLQPDGTTTIEVCYEAVTSNQMGTSTIQVETEINICDSGYDRGMNECAGGSTPTTEYSVVCSDPPTVRNPPVFDGTDNDNDLEVRCLLSPETGGLPLSDLTFLNTCSKTGNSANSRSDDCGFSGQGKAIADSHIPKSISSTFSDEIVIQHRLMPPRPLQ